MEMRERRSQSTIFYDILVGINREVEHGRIIRLTSVQLRCKLAFDKTKAHVASMFELKLIDDPINPRVTKRGNEFIKEYGNMQKEAKKVSLDFNFIKEIPCSMTDVVVSMDYVDSLMEIRESLLATANLIESWSKKQKVVIGNK